MLLENRDLIGILRISNLRENDISLRQSMSSTLNNVDFIPRGMSPSSILIIRELKDPMPGHFVPHSVPPEWSQKLRDSITDIYNTASRPVSGIIPYNASAVFFTDEAELLAYLILDISLMMAGERWWWNLILRNFTGIRIGGLKRIMQVSAVNLPAALFQIYEWGQISCVFSALTPQDSEEIFSEVGKEYGITESQIRWFIKGMRNIGGKQEKRVSTGGSRRQDFSRITDYLRSIIRQDITISIHGKEKISLLALCLILRHRPSLARTQVLFTGLLEYISEFPELDNGFALQEERTMEADRVLQLKNINKKDNTLFIPEKGHENKINAYDLETKINNHDPVNKGRKIITKFDFKNTGSSVDIYSADEKPDTPYVKRVQSNDIQKEISKESINKSGLVVLDADETASELFHEIAYPEREDHKIKDSEKATADDDSSVFQENGINTQLCGVFYLINLMLDLDLPDCFEEDFGLSSQVGAWGTLELLARAIIGNDNRFKTDPIWNILAEFDGRKDGTLVGNQMNEGGSYKMPILWIEKCNQKMDAAFHLEKALPGLSPQLSGFMSCIMPFIRWYIRLALDAGSKKEEPERDMLICNGRLYITSTHIDIMMKLDDISIPVRMAGLDADPGWAVNFGRVVKFHFE